MSLHSLMYSNSNDVGLFELLSSAKNSLKERGFWMVRTGDRTYTILNSKETKVQTIENVFAGIKHEGWRFRVYNGKDADVKVDIYCRSGRDPFGPFDIIDSPALIARQKLETSSSDIGKTNETNLIAKAYTLTMESKESSLAKVMGFTVIACNSFSRGNVEYSKRSIDAAMAIVDSEGRSCPWNKNTLRSVMTNKLEHYLRYITLTQWTDGATQFLNLIPDGLIVKSDYLNQINREKEEIKNKAKGEVLFREFLEATLGDAYQFHNCEIPVQMTCIDEKSGKEQMCEMIYTHCDNIHYPNYMYGNSGEEFIAIAIKNIRLIKPIPKLTCSSTKSSSSSAVKKINLDLPKELDEQQCHEYLRFFDRMNPPLSATLQRAMPTVGLQNTVDKMKKYMRQDRDVFRELLELNLDGLGLTSLPSDILCYTNLRTLSLDGNNIEELPQWIGNLDKMDHLSLARNRIKTLTGHLTECIRLQYIDIRGNPLADEQDLDEELPSYEEAMQDDPPPYHYISLQSVPFIESSRLHGDVQDDFLEYLKKYR